MQAGSCVCIVVWSARWSAYCGCALRPAENVVQGRTTGSHRQLLSLCCTEVSYSVVAVLYGLLSRTSDRCNLYYAVDRRFYAELKVHVHALLSLCRFPHRTHYRSPIDRPPPINTSRRFSCRRTHTRRVLMNRADNTCATKYLCKSTRLR
jgi:hypothetical protein